MNDHTNRKDESLTVRVPRQLVADLNARARQEGEAASVLVRRALRDLLRPQFAVAGRG